METIYDVDYFIKKFEAIPENKWLIGGYVARVFKGTTYIEKMCALGWCGARSNHSNSGNTTREAAALFRIFTVAIAPINDGLNINYQQPTPKQRILAALYDIKAKQQSTEPKEKVIYKTVVIDSVVKELQTALNEN